MDFILQFGIEVAVWFQGLAGWLEAPMKGFSFLGSEEFFLLMLPIVYWCVDTQLGIRLGVILLLNTGINDILKLAFHGPRPYWFDSQVKALSAETSFGVPSGHAQIATGLWGMAAAQLKRSWAWAVAIFLILMIGLSRLYLGVHFLHDVLLGWTLGALVLWFVLSQWDSSVAWLQTKSVGQQIGLALLGSILILVFGAMAYGALEGWELPAEWLTNAQAAGADELPDPVTFNGIVTAAATLFGLLAGLAWITPRGGFETGGSLGRRVARFLVGLLGVVIFWYGMGEIFPHEENLVSYALRYLRYALVGGWISAGGPWVFIRLGLSKPLSKK